MRQLSANRAPAVPKGRGTASLSSPPLARQILGLAQAGGAQLLQAGRPPLPPGHPSWPQKDKAGATVLTSQLRSFGLFRGCYLPALGSRGLSAEGTTRTLHHFRNGENAHRDTHILAQMHPDRQVQTYAAPQPQTTETHPPSAPTCTSRGLTQKPTGTKSPLSNAREISVNKQKHPEAQRHEHTQKEINAQESSLGGRQASGLRPGCPLPGTHICPHAAFTNDTFCPHPPPHQTSSIFPFKHLARSQEVTSTTVVFLSTLAVKSFWCPPWEFAGIEHIILPFRFH